MTMKQILALGAPALPDGYFYRVGRVGLDGLLHVSIMREARWFPRRRMSARLITWSAKDGDINIDKAVRSAAFDAYNSWTRDDRLASWIGDHK